MSRLNSFYLPPENWHSPFVLDGGEARHMIKVLRTRTGDVVRLFDGCGRDGLFKVTSLTRTSVALELEEEKIHPDHRGLSVAIGWNKSSRRGWILEKAVELEARRIIFFQSEFSQGKIPAEVKDSWTEKLVTAAKQCGNSWLPELMVVKGSMDSLVEVSEEYSDRLLLWEKADNESVPDFSVLAGESVLAVIGPEGGFSSREAEFMIESGFRSISLGKSILRWETAALLCLGAAYLERQKAMPGESE
ncbi:16S rRNA (uracil(1498)-N(3))-methyltransferase [Maridesulfovibrio sp.]|uniref:16S rRNA (uracil(1498)-N(3))-methyltransferase n=1 Tax=Maridesulfovibrio sp. TaxID=2795000 RepID=UPI002A18BED6|nr:16S rRNA (uracil(1498)-N(3))-methyltransferase [Maridesulfovibrio sp.]